MPLRRLLVFFATVYAVQGLAEPKAGLATQPIFFLLKDEMRLSAAETATFLALIGFAWNVKPLYGLTSDLVPLLGYRRRSYLLVTTAMAALGWLVLGLLPAYPWSLTLVILGLTGMGLAFTDVLCDAVMVEEGKARGLTARFQSTQWTAIYGASLLAGIAGGYLSAHVSYSRTFLLVALFPALSFAASAWAVHEPRTRFDRATVQETIAALRRGCPLGAALAGRGVHLPLELHPVVRGAARVPHGGRAGDHQDPARRADEPRERRRDARRARLRALRDAARAADAAEPRGRDRRGRDPRLLRPGGLVVGGRAHVVVGFVSAVALLATLDLAARAVPRRAEGTFFAALMSVNNLGTTGAAWLGGQLYDLVGLNWLIAISATTIGAVRAPRPLGSGPRARQDP